MGASESLGMLANRYRVWRRVYRSKGRGRGKRIKWIKVYV